MEEGFDSIAGLEGGVEVLHDIWTVKIAPRELGDAGVTSVVDGGDVRGGVLLGGGGSAMDSGHDGDGCCEGEGGCELHDGCVCRCM